MNANTPKSGLVLFAAVGLLLAGFFLLFEKVETEVPVPGSAEARRNPFLAAERFLNASGIEAESSGDRKRLVALPAADDLIFVNRLTVNLPGKRENRLIQWVQQGGILVITHDKPWKEKLGKSGHTLLDRLGVRLYDTCSKPPAAAADPETDDAVPDVPDEQEQAVADSPCGDRDEVDCCTCDTEVVRVPAGAGEFAEIEFMAHNILQAKDESASSESGRHIVEKNLGKGKLVVFSDNAFLKNERIGQRDHAFYLARLAADRRKVWILHSTNMPSFASVLVRKAPFFCFSVSILTIFGLLWLTLRIGPRYKIRDNARRNITEHLLSAGHFTRRHGNSNALIREVRTGMEKRLAASCGLRHPKTKEDRYQAISERAGLSSREIRSALSADAERPANFMRATRVLQKMHGAMNAKKKKELF